MAAQGLPGPAADAHSLLFSFTPIDAVDDWEKGCWQPMRDRIIGRDDSEVVPLLQQMVLEAGKSEAATAGLLYGALTEEDMEVHAAMRWIQLIVRDDYRAVSTLLRYLLSSPRFDRTRQLVRIRTLPVLSYLMAQKITGVDELLVLAIRQILVGDTSPANLSYVQHVLDLIHQQFVAVEDSIYHPLVVPVAFYAVAGLIRDHIGMTHLQQSARVFSALFQNQFKYVRRLGRELPRIISDLSMLKVTEAIDIGRRMITDPTSIGAGFSGPADLMNAPVARDIYLARISPELESKLRFLLTRTHVRFAEPRKYNIMWLKNKFFPSSEKRSVVVDIVRYVVAKFHPPNDILKSEVVQRWQLISFIILSIPPAGDSLFLHAVRNALLWDWIAYNRETDNVMHVEVPVLVMHYNSVQYISMVTEIIKHLGVLLAQWPERSENIRLALKDVVRTGMLKYDELVSLKNVLPPNEGQLWQSWLPSADSIVVNESNDGQLKLMDLDGPLTADAGVAHKATEDRAPEDLQKLWLDAVGNLLEAIKSRDVAGSRHLVQTLGSNELLTASDPGLEQLADQLQENLRNDLDEQLANIDRKSDVNGSLLGAIIAPLLEKGSSGNATIARKRLLGGLRDKMPQFGAAVLCYIAVAESSNADAWEYYFDGFLDSQSRSKIVDELAEIHGCNLQLFYHVLVTLLQHLTDESLSSSVRTPRLVHLLVSLMDPRALHSLTSRLSMSEFRLFSPESRVTLIESSLSWDSFEQKCFWDLLRADLLDRPREIEPLVGMIGRIDLTVNIEANEGLLALLASVKPNHSVVDTILTIPSPPSDDSVLAAPPFQILALKQWVRIYPKSLVESVTAILVEGKKQLDADRHSTHRSLTELDLGSGQQDVTGAQIVAQLDNILANLVLWRSIIARVGVKDPVLSNEGVRQALQPLLSDERFFSRHQRLLLALAARSNPTILSS